MRAEPMPQPRWGGPRGGRPRSDTGNHTFTQTLLCFAICFLAIASAQYWSGASEAAFDGYPDESAHYLSGLLVRDYLVSGFLASPLAYARNYYLHIPHFAVGYWPPLFYIVEGAWMTVLGYSRPVSLLFPAVIAALTGTTLFVLVRSSTGFLAGISAAVIFLSIPAVQAADMAVMTDTAVALLSFWSLLAFGRYLNSGTWPHSLLFAFLAACTVMTKYSGLYVILLPWLGLLAARRWDLLRRPSLWIQPVIIVLLCAPWVAFTYSFAGVGLDSFKRLSLGMALGQYLRIWVHDLGPWLSVLLFSSWLYAGIALLTSQSFRQLLWIQPLAILLFQAAAPVSPEMRYLIPTLPPLIVLLCLQLAPLGKRFAPAATAAIALGCTVAAIAHFRHSPENQLRPMVETILHEPHAAESIVLVPADQEGPAIAEFAMRDRNRPIRILARPSKLLAEVNWTGANYKARYSNPIQLEHFLEENPLDFVVLHPRVAADQLRHEQLLESAIHDYPARWKLLATVSGYEIYRFAGSLNAGDLGMTPLFRERVSSRFQHP